jgi:hypothetical protein
MLVKDAAGFVIGVTEFTYQYDEDGYPTKVNVKATYEGEAPYLSEYTLSYY